MKITTREVAGLESALHGMRNPLNSWSKCDSHYNVESICEDCRQDISSCDGDCEQYIVGHNDMFLAKRLIKGGTEHRKFLRQIQVWADFDMPRYWWSEMDTYKIGTSANSCSTMHKLLNNKTPITKDMFVSHGLIEDVLEIVVKRLDDFRLMYIGEKEIPEGYTKIDLLVAAKRILADGFLQLRTVNLNYEVIRNVYHQRKYHRLKEEWIDTFCEWAKTLPYADEFIVEEYRKEDN